MSKYPTIRTVIDQLKPLLPGGFRLVVTYNGSNDSGWFDAEIFENAEGRFIHDRTNDIERAETIVNAARNAIHDELYPLLESRFPGWEIGDGEVIGSHGYFTIDSKTDTISQSHVVDYNEENDISPSDLEPF